MFRPCLLMLIALEVSGVLFAQNVKSTSGVIDMDVEWDRIPEARLSASGLVIGGLETSANLTVHGNAVVTDRLQIGEEVSSQHSSNLSVHGSFGTSIAQSDSNMSLDEHSLYLIDTTSTNLMVQLPPAETSLGRMITLKKTSASHRLEVVGGVIERASTLTIPEGGTLLPSLTLINSDYVWRLLSGIGVEDFIYEKKIFHATFDEVSPGPPVDLVNGFVGTVKNMSSDNIGIAGNIGLAIDFDGDSIDSEGDFVTFEPGGAAEGVFDSQTFTLSARINPRNTLDASQSMLIMRRGGSGTLTYRFTLDQGDYQLRLRVTYTDGQTQDIASSTTIPLNVWSHVVGILDGEYLKLYVDGVSVKTPIATGGKILVNGGETGLDIGGGSASTLNFHGVIDDVRIYNYGLSDAEVVQLYQGTLD